MTVRAAIAVVLLAGLTLGGCSCLTGEGDSNDAPRTEAFPSGGMQFAVSDVQSDDGCKLGAEFPAPFLMTIADKTAYLDAFAGTPRGTVDGESLSLQATHPLDHRAALEPYDCQERISFRLDLKRTRENVYSAELTFTSAAEVGAQCGRAPTPLPCTTHATFTATRVPLQDAIDHIAH